MDDGDGDGDGMSIDKTRCLIFPVAWLAGRWWTLTGWLTSEIMPCRKTSFATWVIDWLPGWMHLVLVRWNAVLISFRAVRLKFPSAPVLLSLPTMIKSSSHTTPSVHLTAPPGAASISRNVPLSHNWLWAQTCRGIINRIQTDPGLAYRDPAIPLALRPNRILIGSQSDSTNNFKRQIYPNNRLTMGFEEQTYLICQ